MNIDTFLPFFFFHFDELLLQFKFGQLNLLLIVLDFQLLELFQIFIHSIIIMFQFIYFI